MVHIHRKYGVSGVGFSLVTMIVRVRIILFFTAKSRHLDPPSAVRLSGIGAEKYLQLPRRIRQRLSYGMPLRSARGLSPVDWVIEAF